MLIASIRPYYGIMALCLGAFLAFSPAGGAQIAPDEPTDPVREEASDVEPFTEEVTVAAR